MLWLDYFSDDCPPNSAQPASVQVYRFIDECQACGLSVFTRPERVCTALRRKPFLQQKQIAIGQLTTENGVLLHTPSKGTGDNHYT